MLGIMISQLFILQEPGSGYGYHEIGRPMATVCLCFSIGSVLLGAHRAWRHQLAVVSGKARAGGFEIAVLAFGTLVVRHMFCPSFYYEFCSNNYPLHGCKSSNEFFFFKKKGRGRLFRPRTER